MKRTYCWRRIYAHRFFDGPRSGEGEAANVIEVFENVSWRSEWSDGLTYEVWPKACPTNVMKAYRASGTPRGFAITDNMGQLYP